jgi:hypothetical protein
LSDSGFDEVNVFVRLLDEGRTVFRPTRAISLGDGIYCLLPTSDYDAAIETWEFFPGSLVSIEERIGPDGRHLLAIPSNR